MQPTSLTQEAHLHFLDYWRVIKSRWIFVFIILLVVVLVAAVVTYMQPKLYQSAVRIKVEQERPTVAVFDRQQLPNYDPFFLQTQYEIIQSRKILDPVMERLNLAREWGSKDAELPASIVARQLKGALSIRRFRDTSLIEIGVSDENPRRAADIANALAESFERDRLEVRRDATLKGIRKLREELDAQGTRLQQAQTKVERLRRELNVPVFGTLRLSDITLQALENQLTAAKVEAVRHKAKLDELQKLQPDQLRNTIATLINDPNVQGLLQTLTESERRMEVLKQDYGPDHPNVRAEQTSLEKVREQLDARLEGIMRSFVVEWQMAQSGVDYIHKQLDVAKQASMVMESDQYLPFRNAQREEESETRHYEALEQRLQQESVEMDLPRSPVEVVERAEPALFPYSPRMTLNLVIGVAVGLLLGVVMAFFLEFLDTSIKRVEDVEHYLGLPVLGVVPQGVGAVSRGEAAPAHVEAYRMLRANIEFARGENAGNSFCAVSAAPGEGKSFTVSNLACVCAQYGVRVLLVDADMRRPTLQNIFDLPNTVGLADYLVAAKSLEEVVQASAVPNVAVITAGSGGNSKSALPMLTSPRMLDLIREAGQRYDIVLYDTPPVLGVSDAVSLARDVGAAFLVIQHRRYPRHMSRRARQVIDSSGAKLLGVVVNNVRLDQADTYFYYHHQYDDYLNAPDLRAKESTAAVAQAPGKRKGKSDKIEISGKF